MKASETMSGLLMLTFLLFLWWIAMAGFAAVSACILGIPLVALGILEKGQYEYFYFANITAWWLWFITGLLRRTL